MSPCQEGSAPQRHTKLCLPCVFSGCTGRFQREQLQLSMSIFRSVALNFTRILRLKSILQIANCIWITMGTCGMFLMWIPEFWKFTLVRFWCVLLFCSFADFEQGAKSYWSRPWFRSNGTVRCSCPSPCLSPFLQLVTPTQSVIPSDLSPPSPSGVRDGCKQISGPYLLGKFYQKCASDMMMLGWPWTGAVFWRVQKRAKAFNVFVYTL